MEQLTEILRRLHEARVEFSLIGGLAGRHYGVTLVTEDVDICARFTPDNLRRIERALKAFHPRHRMTPSKLPFELTDYLCETLKNLYLISDLGILDCLSQVAGLGDFEAVLRQSELKEFPFGRCNVLKIGALIAAKQALGRPHDLMAVTQLRAIKEKTESSSGPSQP
jgi:hypothetical protein